MKIITPEMKDVVLVDLLSADSPRFKFNYENYESDYGFSSMYVDLILDEFVKLDLIRETKLIGESALIQIQTKAMDLYRHGGFKAEEELLKNNIKKFGLELDVLSKQLAPDLAEKASRLVQIANTIIQSLTLFKE